MNVYCMDHTYEHKYIFGGKIRVCVYTKKWPHAPQGSSNRHINVTETVFFFPESKKSTEVKKENAARIFV